MRRFDRHCTASSAASGRKADALPNRPDGSPPSSVVYLSKRTRMRGIDMGRDASTRTATTWTAERLRACVGGVWGGGGRGAAGGGGGERRAVAPRRGPRGGAGRDSIGERPGHGARACA